MTTLGIYKHYKTGQLYKVIAEGLLESDEQPVVIYEALYPNDKSQIWVRSTESFTQMVKLDGVPQPRFKLTD